MTAWDTLCETLEVNERDFYAHQINAAGLQKRTKLAIRTYKETMGFPVEGFLLA